jgi:hypothetical protein
LFHDLDGLDDGRIDGSGLGNPSGVTVYAYLVDEDGNVAFKTTVNSGDGTYSFPLADVDTTYTLRLSTASADLYTPAPTEAFLPLGWAMTGDSYGRFNVSGSGEETGTPDLSIPIITETRDIRDVDFGIQQVNAGPDGSVCYDDVIDMAAITTPGFWTSHPGNPGFANIVSPGSPDTEINSFGDAGTYSFIWTNNGVSDTANVEVFRPNCSITGLSEMCLDEGNQLYSAPAGMSAYSWSITGAAGSISGSASAQNVTVVLNSAGTFTLSLSVTDSNGCISFCERTVSVLGIPVCTISGPGSVCIGQVLYQSAVSSDNYQWSVTGNATIVGADDEQNLTLDATAVGSYTLTLTVTSNSGCFVTCQQNVSVSAVARTNPHIMYYRSKN